MAFASGSQTSIAYVAETNWSTTPATPSLVTFPVTSYNMRPVKEAYESKDIRGDRQTTDLRHGFQHGLLDIAFEYKHNNFDWLLEGALFGEFSANVLKGGNTRKFYTIESRHADITQYFKMVGGMVKTLGFKCDTSGMVTGTAQILGKSVVRAGTSVDGDGYGAHAARSSMASFQGSLQEGGSPIASVTSIEFTLDNGIEPVKVVGSTTATGLVEGRQKVSGKLSAYFENGTLFDKFVDETATSIQVQLLDPSSNSITILLPEVKYSAAEVPVDGETGVIIGMPFTAIYDTGEATAIKITRSV